MGFMANAIAGAGLLITALVLVKAGVRFSKKIGDADAAGKINLNLFGNMESLSFLLLAGLTHVAVIAIVVALWYWIGLVRVAATAYLLQISAIVMVFLFFAPPQNQFNTGPQSDPALAASSHVPRNANPRFGPGRPTGPEPRFDNGGGLPGPMGRRNALGLPPDEVALLIVQLPAIKNYEKIDKIKETLTSELPSSEWHADQNSSALTLTIKYYGTMQNLRGHIEAKNILKIDVVNQMQRLLVLRPI